MTDDELRWLRDSKWAQLQHHITLLPCWVAPYLSLLVGRILTHEEGMRLLELINERTERESPEAAVTRLRDVVRSESAVNWRRPGAC